MGIPHAHWVMDLYPDVLAAHGLLNPEGWPYRSLQALQNGVFRDASQIIALGPYMARRIEDGLGGPLPGLDWVPLWADPLFKPQPPERTLPVREKREWPPGELVLLYSGNMGLGHRFDEFLEAAARLGQGGPRWVFQGGGKGRRRIESFVQRYPEARIELAPYLPREELPAALSAADVHLASLDKAWQGLIVPSKLQGSFALARPVLAVCPPDNELAHWIHSSGGGWVAGEGDVEGLMEAVREASGPGERRRRGQAGLAFAQAHFSYPPNAREIAGKLGL
jgi:glycosyltransferase involved in cell wall biosynthesis